MASKPAAGVRSAQAFVQALEPMLLGCVHLGKGVSPREGARLGIWAGTRSNVHWQRRAWVGSTLRGPVPVDLGALLLVPSFSRQPPHMFQDTDVGRRQLQGVHHVRHKQATLPRQHEVGEGGPRRQLCVMPRKRDAVWTGSLANLLRIATQRPGPSSSGIR